MRYADDLLLGIVGVVELLIEIQKRIAHFLQSGLNLWVFNNLSSSYAPLDLGFIKTHFLFILVSLQCWYCSSFFIQSASALILYTGSLLHRLD